MRSQAGHFQLKRFRALAFLEFFSGHSFHGDKTWKNIDKLKNFDILDEKFREGTLTVYANFLPRIIGRAYVCAISAHKLLYVTSQYGNSIDKC
jgi:hypothetical protein